MKKILGLTGDIAAGKSTVAGILVEQFGAQFIEADKVAHGFYVQGSPVFQQVLDIFGNDILGDDGNIDRKRLGRIVFADAEKMGTLESLVHPFIMAEIQNKIDSIRDGLIVVEMAEIFRFRIADVCDSIWIVTAPENIRVQRLLARNEHLSYQEALDRIKSQKRFPLDTARFQEKITTIDTADILEEDLDAFIRNALFAQGLVSERK